MRYTLALLALSAATVEAADWPQWLGPRRDGTSTEKVSPWTTAPTVVWRHAVGEGHSSPVVADGKVFLHYKVDQKEEEAVAAWDAASGKQLWVTTYTKDKFVTPFGNGPRGSPTVEAGKVYTYGITGVLACFQAADGKRLWQVDTLKEFGAKNLIFGVSCSPLVDGNRVIVQVGAKGAGIVAFDAATGKVAWKSQDDSASYSSPILVGNGSARQVVFLTGRNVLALNPENGNLLWQHPFVDKLFESSSTPVLAGETLVASSITLGSVGLKWNAGKPAVVEAWKQPALTCYFATPVAVGKDHLFVVTGSNPLAVKRPVANLACIEVATGKELWKKANVGKYHASLLRTGDDKLLMLDDGGNLLLLEPNPQEYREQARSKVCGETWAHPALAQGRLYIRDSKELLCVQLNP